MFIISFFRTIKFAFVDFVRNFWLSVVTVTVLILTLLTINILLVFNYLTIVSVNLVESKLDVTVFFKPEVVDEDVLSVQKDIESLPQVKSVEFVSREQRVQDFQKAYSDDEVIMESVNEISTNPFGAALVIRAYEPSDYEIIVNVLDQEAYSPLIEEKDYKNHQDVIEKITSITSRIKVGGQFMSLVFGIIAILIVFNTIRIAIYTHKDEIVIMKTVGAENWFIRFPYIMQGMLYSIFAVAITVGIWFFILRVFDSYIVKFFGDTVSLNAYFTDNFIAIFGLEMLGVTVVNVLSSSVAVRRYLRN